MTVHLGVLREDLVMHVDKVGSDSPIQMRSYPGPAVPTYCAAIGKALMAVVTPRAARTRLAESISPLTTHAHAAISTLVADPQKVHARGYSFIPEENEEGIGPVGAAKYDDDDRAVGAISPSVIPQRLTRKPIPALG